MTELASKPKLTGMPRGGVERDVRLVLVFATSMNPRGISNFPTPQELFPGHFVIQMRPTHRCCFGLLACLVPEVLSKPGEAPKRRGFHNAFEVACPNRHQNGGLYTIHLRHLKPHAQNRHQIERARGLNLDNTLEDQTDCRHPPSAWCALGIA